MTLGASPRGKSSGQRCISGRWGCAWSPEAATEQLYWSPRVGERVAGREGDWVARLSVTVDWGGAPITANSLCWSTKVPPSGVGFLSVHHPEHW